MYVSDVNEKKDSLGIKINKVKEGKLNKIAEGELPIAERRSSLNKCKPFEDIFVFMLL